MNPYFSGVLDDEGAGGEGGEGGERQQLATQDSAREQEMIV